MSNFKINKNDTQPPTLVTPYKDDLPDNVYFNLQIKGSNAGTGKYDPHARAEFNQSFANFYLTHCSHYYASAVTVSVPTHNVPLAIFNNIQSGRTQTDPNLSNMYLCFGYGGDYYGGYIRYVPSSNKPEPLPPSANPPSYKQFPDTYYNVYNYNQLCRMINATISFHYSNFYTAHPGVNGLSVSDSPYMIFDDINNRFSLIYNKKFLSSGIELFYNDAFSIKFGGFDDYFFGVSGDERDYSFRFIDSKNNSYDANNNFNRQMYSSISPWQSINQVLLISTSIRTRSEWIGTNDSSDINAPSILFSLNPDFLTPSEMKSKITYTTSGNYRLVDVLGTGDLQTLNMSLYYTDQNNNIYPFHLAEGEVATIKLLFVKRTLFNNW